LQEGQYESSVAAVRDRIVQAAVKIVLEPVFEADFLPCSFGVPPEAVGARCPAGAH
jgi:retron-type reverse transcriptase